jgi:hypothetical protein
MTKFSLKRSHYSLNTPFEWEKLSFDDFSMTTWEREVESQRKKKPKIPQLNLVFKKFISLLISSGSVISYTRIFTEIYFFPSEHCILLPILDRSKNEFWVIILLFEPCPKRFWTCIGTKHLSVVFSIWQQWCIERSIISWQ